MGIPLSPFRSGPRGVGQSLLVSQVDQLLGNLAVQAHFLLARLTLACIFFAFDVAYRGKQRACRRATLSFARGPASRFVQAFGTIGGPSTILRMTCEPHVSSGCPLRKLEVLAQPGAPAPMSNLILGFQEHFAGGLIMFDTGRMARVELMTE
jgi:hypothetical protein